MDWYDRFFFNFLDCNINDIMEEYIMGDVKDLIISGSSNEKLQAMADNARIQYTEGYIKFLEEQLEKAEKRICKLTEFLKATLGPGYCVECFKYLPKGEITCNSCQDKLDGGWDDLRE